MCESEEDTWGDEDWENRTHERRSGAIDLDWKCIVWTVAGNGRSTDVDEGAMDKGTSICVG